MHTLKLFIYYFVYASFIGMVFHAPTQDAYADPACPGQAAQAGDPQISTLAAIQYKLTAPNTEDASVKAGDRWVSMELDASTPNNLNSLNVNELATYKGNSLNLSAAQSDQVNKIYAAVVGASKAGNPYGHATTLPDALALLASVKDNLSMNQRILLQSMIGKFLGAHYSTATVSNPNLNALWANDVQHQVANAGGGVCVDIHHILAQTAAQLGFEAAGTQSLTWMNKQETGGHDIALYRDPSTGHYYSQNYGVIVDTGARTEQAALNVSTKMLDAISNVTMVDDANGHIHAYVPANALFLHKLIGDASNAEAAPIHGRIGNNEQNLNAHLKVDGMQVFALTDRSVNANGASQISALGVSQDRESELRGSPNSRFEERLSAHLAAGVVNSNVASFDSFNNNPQHLKATNGFIEADFAGTVRLDRTTGHLEFAMQDYGLIGTSMEDPYMFMNIGADHSMMDGRLTAGVNRRYDVVDDPKSQRISAKLRTAYDEVSILFETAHDHNVYLKLGQKIYLMDGVNKLSAVVLKEKIQAIFRNSHVGTFSIDGEVAKDISNPSKSAFDDFNSGSSLAGSWSKRLNGYLEVGAKLTHTQGTRDIASGITVGPISPDMGNEMAHTDGSVMLNIHF